MGERAVSASGQPRMLWMDALRGLAILAVIFDHGYARAVSKMGENVAAFEMVADGLAPFRMATLMFLSGVLLPVSMRKSTRVFIEGKISGIAWPYIVWSFALIGLLTATASLSNYQPSLLDFARVFYDPPTYHWFLAYLFLYYLLALVIPERFRGYLIPILLVGSGIAASEEGITRFLYLFAFFLIGDLYARNQARLAEGVSRARTLIVCVGLSGAAALASVASVSVRYEAAWAPCVIAFIVCAKPVCERIAPTEAGRMLRYFGRTSIVFYVSHVLVMMVLSALLQRAGIASVAATVLTMFVLSVAVGVALDRARSYAIISALFTFPRRLPRLANSFRR